MDKKQIVILGGGYSGVHAGLILEKHFRKNPDVEITLIDRNTFHTLMTELHEVAGHRVEPESVQVPFRKIFGGKRVRVVNDNIRTVDFSKKAAVGERGRYPFDYIVIGSGSEPEFFGIPGIREHSYTLWSFEDALRLRHHLETVFRRAETEPDPARRRSLLTFVVAGAGFTGVEMAGELLEYRDVMCRKYAIDRADVKVTLIEALPTILPILNGSLRAKAEARLRKMNCDVRLDSPITGAEKGLVRLADGSAVETDTFIWTCGVMGARFAGMLSLTKGRCGNRGCYLQRAQGTCGMKDCLYIWKNPDTANKKGRVLVNDEMRSADYRNVFAAGDNGWFLENNKPLPQIVETAEQTAATAAHNIIADIECRPPRKFKSSFHGFMVCVGSRWGVSDAGGLMLSGFAALAMKHLINLYYLFGIAGVNQCWEYLKHEFLDARERRSLLGGFVTHKVRSYWLLPLRMWLGFMWLVEATNKITEGWLSFADGNSRTAWMFSPGVVQAGVHTAAASAAAASVDAASAASGAVAAAAPAVVDAASAATGAVSAAAPAVDAAGAAAGSAAAAVTAHGPWLDTARTIFDPHSPLVTWFRQTFMDGIFAFLPYTWFQVMIVAVELGIGLALLGGFFTWFAAVASIGLCLIFTLSGMFAWNQLWFIFAAILCMGGAGRAFGLDSWSVPFFKRWWNGTLFARRSRLYTDNPTR